MDPPLFLSLFLFHLNVCNYTQIMMNIIVLHQHWVPMEGQVVAMVARPAPATILALHRAVVYFGCKGAVNQLLELLGGF